MHGRRQLAAIATGGALALGLLAAPAGAAPTTPAKPAAAVDSKRDGLSDTKVLKPRGQRSRTADVSAAYCGAEITRMVTAPTKLSVGVQEVKRITFTVDVYDPCDEVGDILVSTYGTNSFEWIEGYLGYDDDLGNDTYRFSSYLDVDPRDNTNDSAGAWEWDATAEGYDGEFVTYDSGSRWYMQRVTRITNNAAPEPVRKGSTITVSGYLDRANWASLSYRSYSGQTLTLQQRPASGGTYTNVRNVTTSSTGKVSTKVTAASDVCFRYVYAGKGISTASTGKGDCVDVT